MLRPRQPVHPRIEMITEDIGEANKTQIYSSVRNDNYKYQTNCMYIVSKILVILHSHNLKFNKTIC
jgi:hypothetical protein